MMDESKHLSRDERLDAENQFLKLKLMAEYGGQFYSVDSDTNIPNEIENQFLNNVIEFEKQFSAGRTITVFEKIGSPGHFKSVSEIPDDEMDQAWEDLSEHMCRHGVDLSACSPRVTAGELYRFATEELFKHETDDISIPGMVTGFIYDEFYPDVEYDNTRTAIHECLQRVFCKLPIEWMHYFSKEVRFNDNFPITREALKEKINRFKETWDEIELEEVNASSAKLSHSLCVVQGAYSAVLSVQSIQTVCKGNWEVQFILDEQFDDWSIKNVLIEGLAI